ncbi:MAG: Ppx/GppA family phosphatase [Deferribacterales bacterium]
MENRSILNKNIAVIDVGSNSIRLQIVKVFEKSYKVVAEYKDVVRIGDDLFTKGYLSESAEEKIYNAFSSIKSLLDTHKVELIRGVATATLRSAPNGTQIIKNIKEKFDIDIDIIDGELEAKISFLGVKSSFNLPRYKALITDVGGGSAEFILSHYGEIERIYTKKLGGARLKNQFLIKNPPSSMEIDRLKQFLKNEFVDFREFKVDNIICTGGTANNIAVIYYIKNKKDISNPIKYVPRDFLRNLINQFKHKKSSTISQIKGVEPQRADIILPVAIEIDQILEITETGGFYTFSGGLRTGLIIDTLNNYGIKLPFQTLETDTNIARLTEIGNKFHFDEDHASQVRKLSKIIFDQTKEVLKLNENDWSYLHAAVILHDIGNFISHSKQHLHSEYLIRNSDLIGFSSYEKNIISQIARYHRKRKPKNKDSLYSLIKQKDLNKVLILAGILRIADALDRTHKNKISNIKITFKEKHLILRLEYVDDISLELKDFELKKDFLEEYSGYKVEIA